MKHQLNCPGGLFCGKSNNVTLGVFGFFSPSGAMGSRWMRNLLAKVSCRGVTGTRWGSVPVPARISQGSSQAAFANPKGFVPRISLHWHPEHPLFHGVTPRLPPGKAFAGDGWPQTLNLGLKTRFWEYDGKTSPSISSPRRSDPHGRHGNPLRCCKGRRPRNWELKLDSGRKKNPNPELGRCSVVTGKGMQR